MESLQTTKTRLKAVKNVGQITKAMEVVAATKMRRAQEAALNSRPYAYEALKLLDRVLGQKTDLLPLAVGRPIRKTLVLVVASDRGLAGSFNSQVFKLADQFLARDGQAGAEHEYLLAAVGKKAQNFAAKKPYRLVRSFDNALDITDPTAVTGIAEFLTGGFLDLSWDRVVTVSTHFRTALKQEALIRQLLPLSVDKIRETIREIVPEHGRFAEEKIELGGQGNSKSAHSGAEEIDYIFEPSPLEVLNELMPHLIGMQIYHLFLEAKASEHSARRVAMKTASDNANELTDTLSLEYNKARQVGITRELSEITTTIMTLE
jgi:F-type H+-transporting ATPase subunit gamma